MIREEGAQRRGKSLPSLLLSVRLVPGLADDGRKRPIKPERGDQGTHATSRRLSGAAELLGGVGVSVAVDAENGKKRPDNLGGLPDVVGDNLSRRIQLFCDIGRHVPARYCGLLR